MASEIRSSAVLLKNRKKRKKESHLINVNFFSLFSEHVNVPWDHAEAEEDSKLAAAKWLFSINTSLLEGSSPREAAFNGPTG